MEIIVTTMTRSYTLTVRPTDTVGHLKVLIRDKIGVSIAEQRLTFDSTHLSNESRTLQSYGLHQGARVTLLVVQPEKIQVFLKTEKGETHTYDVKPAETVDDFKKSVECREGVKVSQQRLIYQGKEMMGGTLSDYGVREHSTIDLALRLRGG